ncbi:MAG TPA: sigma-70 family RNA polymerase sigma factor [Chthoniobacteraceae bacterium]|nr:sigma-70 family RNA polymerase sigma factor [Chthoniobacteraceae bacterium]
MSTTSLPLSLGMKDAESVTVGKPCTLADVSRLTVALKRGDESAFALLHRAWSGRINRYCFALAAGDENFAAEIAQAAWWRLVKHIRVMDDEQALWNWIACAARHAATDLRRKGKRYLLALTRFFEFRTYSTPLDSQDESADLLAALESALERLTPEERMLIEKRYFERDSLEAIGASLSLSTRAVEGRLARVRLRLREMVAMELKLNA